MKVSASKNRNQAIKMLLLIQTHSNMIMKDRVSYQERAAALESLLELCAELFEQNRLEELAGVLKPFGKHGASPRETAIWLTKSLKAINKVHHDREKFL